MKPTEGTGDRNGAGEPKRWRDKPSPRLFVTKMCVVLYLLVGCMTVFQVETDRHIIDHGVRVEGIVESADFRHAGEQTYETTVWVRYDRPDGTSARFETSVRGSREQGPKAKAGETVTVFYDPLTDPEEAVVEKLRARYGAGPLVFAVLLLVMGMFESLFTAASVPEPLPPRTREPA